MLLFYKLSLFMLRNAFAFLALFHNKANKWHTGRKNWRKKIADSYKYTEKTLWIHAASLGEFEQGRPLMEMLKKKNPEYQIVLTFFSPSGYEVQKDYEGADYVYYLPLDSAKTARDFLDIIRPSKAIFVKYEFWYFYLKTLAARQIPTYLISSVFRKEHLFFKWYGKWYQNMLRFFTHLYVQDKASAQLLASIGIDNVSVAGDTRFDRVGEITDNVKENVITKAFKGERTLVVVGSSWPTDEEILCKYINEESTSETAWLIAPHEIDEGHLKKIENQIDTSKKILRYSQATTENIGDADVLLIDNIGLLSSLYAYGDFAHIGGGFTDGIHNTLEAATFGMPITFGPDYHKFNEAIEMISDGCAFCVENYSELKEKFDFYLQNTQERNSTSEIAANYVKRNRGASKRVFDDLKW